MGDLLMSLKQLVKSGQKREAIELFESVQDKTTDFFNQMIKLSNCVDEANQFFNRMIEHKCVPNESTLTFMLNCTAKYELARVEELMTKMDTKYNLKSNRVHFSVVIHAYILAKQMNAAESAYQRMLDQGIEADHIVLRILMRGYVEIGEIEKARAIVDQLASMGIKMIRVDYEYYKAHGLL
jgi:pentatricopeptide repeat protein